MASKYQQIAQAARPAAELAIESMLGFLHGLRTSVPASMLAATELAECTNFQINQGGQLQSRPGMRKLNNTNLGEIISLGQANIGTEVMQFMQTADFSIYEIDSAGDHTLVGIAEGKAKILSYGGYAMIADGGVLKYIDDSKTLKLAWDGSSPGLFDNRSDEVIGSTDYTVAQTKSVPFTTEDWVAGYTIEPTQVEVKLGRIGTGGTGDITMEIRLTSDDSLIASGPIEIPAASIAPDTGDFYSANMETINAELLPDTAYYVKLTMTTYNATNYIKWYWGEGDIPICGVSPGLAPQASHGIIHERRLWVYGDPDAKSRMYFNNYAPFDWSTHGLAGYLTALDDSKDSFPVGALMPYFGSLFVYGTREWPFLLRLTGTTAADFLLKDLQQPIWTGPLQITDVVNDIWALSKVGVSSMTGVNMYGDVRTNSESFAIEDQVEELWTADAFTGYYVDRGQMFVQLGDKTFVTHTKAPAQGLNRVRYPWSEYTFPFKPTCFGQWDDLVIGTEEGFIYTPDDTQVLDDGVKFLLGLKSKYYISPFQSLDVLEAKVLIDSRTGAGFDFRAYKDNSSTEFVYDWLMSAALHDDVTIDDLGDLLVEDMDFAVDPTASPLVVKLGFRCFSYQIELRAINLIGAPVYLNGLVIRYRPMED